jgi:hypothetical protein
MKVDPKPEKREVNNEDRKDEETDDKKSESTKMPTSVAKEVKEEKSPEVKVNETPKKEEKPVIDAFAFMMSRRGKNTASPLKK